MRVSGVGAAPVLHSENECAGILTERDVVVTMDPVTCAPEEDVAVVAERMREHEVQHLPVCREGEVVGVISLADIVFRRPDEERGTLAPPSRAASR